MNLNKLLFLLVFLLLGTSCFSQRVLKGVVRDSLQNPLPYANVIAQTTDSLQKVKMEFSITDEQGNYRLDLKETSYAVTTSYLGYLPYRFEITPTQDTERDIVLKQKAEELGEVVIEPPVVVKEDTIVYTVDKFVKGDERKLKDVLKKLPGIEVARDGTVTVQGKKVTVLLVENKKFFGGGTKLGVDNIPANAIDKVEVLDNYNEVSFLKGLEDTNDMALNVKLKEDKKNFVFGDIEAGKGNEDFYNVHSNLFYYSPKTSVNSIGNLNNTAKQVFTYKQYSDFQNGINRSLLKGNTNFDLPTDEFSQFLKEQDVTSSDRKFGALNISNEFNDKINIAGYGIFSHTKEGTLTETYNQYNTFSELKEQTSNLKNTLGIASLNATYLPNLTDQWLFKTQFKRASNVGTTRLQSVVDTINNSFISQDDVVNTFFNQIVEWHRKKSKNHIFSFATNYQFDERYPKMNLFSDMPILEGFVPLMEAESYELDQLKKIKRNQLDAIFKYYWVLNGKNHIYTTLGNTLIGNRFITNDMQILDDGSMNNFNTSGFGNDLDFSLNDFFFGVHYKFKTGIFTLDQGAFLHQYNWNIAQQEEVSKSKAVLLPSVSIKAKFSKRKELEFSYEINSSFSNASMFANRLYVLSYNSVFKGNNALENQLSHNFRLRFNKFSTYRGFSYYITFNYAEKTKGVINDVNYEGINQSVIPIYIDNPSNRFSVYGRIRKNVKNINLAFGFHQFTSKYLQNINSVLETNKSNNFSYNLSAKTLFDNFPTIEAGFKQSVGTYTLSSSESKFVTTEPFINIDYDFLKGCIASFDFTSYTYKNKTFNAQNNYDIANASLYYKNDNSAWSFKIEAKNLFNVQYKNSNSFSSYIISDTRNYIMPRILMFSVGYNL
ncbi:TonB-dependent receptor [Joostella sp. CR20]|uniref:TonB-dependent receptor n=1 Tax=Joostella sp. CR20 TaxID=2804312 RepID=UPI00313E52A2